MNLLQQAKCKPKNLGRHSDACIPEVKVSLEIGNLTQYDILFSCVSCTHFTLDILFFHLGDYGESPGLGLLRLHSTFRHDLKIYASDEGRVQMTAAAFAKVKNLKHLWNVRKFIELNRIRFHPVDSVASSVGFPCT